MKRIAVIIAALSAVACNRFDVLEQVPFIASIESASADTKTELDENLAVVWSADDEISVFDGTSLNERYGVDRQSVGKSVATLVKAESSSADKGNAIDFNIAVYPFNENVRLSKAGSGYDVSGLALSQKQYYKAGSFGKDASPMIAITSSTQDRNFAFKNLCGAIKLQLTGTSTIKSISLVGNDNETLWGSFMSYTGNLRYDEKDPSINFSGKGKVLSLDCGEGVKLNDNPVSFVIIVPPLTFTQGFTALVTDTDGRQMELKTDKRQTVKRSSILKMPVVRFIGDYLEPDHDYLTFTSSGENEIAFNNDRNNAVILFEYSLNGDFWQDYRLGDGIRLEDKDRLSFRAKKAMTSFSYKFVSGNYYFSNRGSGTVAASGSVMSLVDPSCEATAIPCQDCFYRLFADFTSLTSAPELPATTLTKHCYSEMFLNCTGLKEAPELPATSLDEYCYEGMFEGCTALESASKLPAVYTMPYCYYRMFSGCESLKAAPELPATDISMYSYYYMFANCSALEKAPELNSNSLSTECYAHMFENCTNLRSASELPATILAPSCYDYMYRGCTSLVDAPALSATTLAEACYRGMFENCTSLKSAPQLRVPTLVRSCYAEMFRNCSSLAYIKCLASDISAYNCTGSWVEGVSASGTFVRDSHARWEDGINGIPAGWMPAVEDESEEIDYLTFTSIGNNELSLQRTGSIGDYLNLKYRINGGAWIDYKVGDGIPMSDGDKVSFKTVGIIYRYAYSNTNHYYFANTGSGKIAASGSIMSLLDPYCESLTITEDHCFTGLFKDFTSLVSAPELPATSLNSYCYSEMFSGCTSLETVPDLPATVLAPFCYMDMFNGCTGLVSAPAILATTQARSACSGMFSNCTSLENTSDLLAEELDEYCYSGMFNGCTSLKKAPAIFAKQMKKCCCFDMFYGCSSLVTPPALSAIVLDESCYSRMFALCESLEEAPELPAPTLEKSCYNMMFYGCTSLRYIKCLATDISAQYCLYSWVEGVSPTGMFEKDPNAKWPRGESGIPAGWKIDGVSEDNLDAYNAWLGEWKIQHGTSKVKQDTWTFTPKEEGCSFSITGIEGVEDYPVEAIYDYANNSITVYATNSLGIYQADGLSYNIGFYAATTSGNFFGPAAVVFTGTLSDGKITIRPQQIGSVVPELAVYLIENSGDYYVLKDFSDATRLPNVLSRDGNTEIFEGDGDVVTIQERGTKLDLIIMGDGFIQEDFNDGTYDRIMRQVYNEFFSVEPYTTIKNDFNVYYVKAVSPERILATTTGANGAINTGHRTKFSTKFTPNSTSVTGDTDLIREYASLAIKTNVNERMRNATVVVVANQKCRAGTCYNMWYNNNGYDYGQAFSISFCALGNYEEERVEILHHEICGHGFGKLADEYTSGSVFSSTSQWEELKRYQKLGLFRNTDIFVNENLYQQLGGLYPLTTSENVLWQDMFGTINNYESPDVESLGVYEGGYTYSRGFCRPTRNATMSIMNYNTGIFNAISRRQIYYRYLRLSGKVTENQFGTKEELDRFLEWDREFILPKIIPTLKSARKVTPPNYVDARLPLAPPVNIVGTWEGKRFIPINQKKRVEFKQSK